METSGVWVLSDNGLVAVNTLSGVIIAAEHRPSRGWQSPPDPERSWEIFATHIAVTEASWWSLAWVKSQDEARETIRQITSGPLLGRSWRSR